MTASSLPSAQSGTPLHLRAKGTHSPEVQGNTWAVMLQETLAIALASSPTLPPPAVPVAMSFVIFPDALPGAEDKENGLNVLDFFFFGLYLFLVALHLIIYFFIVL